jgi:hypothetical protein
MSIKNRHNINVDETYGNRIRTARFLRPDLWWPWGLPSLPKTLSRRVTALLKIFGRLEPHGRRSRDLRSWLRYWFFFGGKYNLNKDIKFTFLKSVWIRLMINKFYVRERSWIMKKMGIRQINGGTGGDSGERARGLYLSRIEIIWDGDGCGHDWNWCLVAAVATRRSWLAVRVPVPYTLPDVDYTVTKTICKQLLVP